MKALGCIGQSNGYGVADHRAVSSPATAPQLARLKYFQVSMGQFTDSVGTITPFAFDPALQDSPINGDYDYNPSVGAPDYTLLPYTFGPDIYCGVTVSVALAEDLTVVKLSPGATALTSREVGTATLPASWFIAAAHKSWDTTIARSSAPYTVTVNDSGTSTAMTSSTLTDGTKSWATNVHAGRWVTRGSYQAYIVSNTATVLTLLGGWFPYWTGVPATGAYQIQTRSLTPASLAKAFTEGYCVAANTAAGGGLDFRHIIIALGETDSMELATAQAAKSNMLALIWWVRQRLKALGLTTLEAGRIGISLSLIQEIPIWAYASIVNAGFREIAAADPYVRLVPLDGITTGGYAGGDDIHYNGTGQKLFGQRHGAAMLDLLSAPAATRKSHDYFGQHVTVRPVWSIGGKQWSTWPGLSGVADSARTDPIFYLLRDEEAGSYPVYLDGAGRTLSNSPSSGSRLLGYARSVRGAGMDEVDAFQMVDPSSRGLGRGGVSGKMAKGFCWPMGFADSVAFPSAWRSFTLGGHQIEFDHGVGAHRARVTIAGTGIAAREFLQRGYCGSMALSSELRVYEAIGTGAPWMHHRIGWGSYRRAAASGVGMAHMPPVISATRTPTSLSAEVTAVEAGVDEGITAPLYQTGRTTDEMNHGGVAADGDAVLWPNVRISQTIHPNWDGREGVHRIVHTLTFPVALGVTSDTIEWWLNAYLTDNFGLQWGVDVASATKTDGAYSQAQNAYWSHALAASTKKLADGTLVSTNATWFPNRAALIAWDATSGTPALGDGLCVGIYATFAGRGQFGSASRLVIGGEVNPGAAANPAFGSSDQLTAMPLHMVFDIPAGTVIAAGTTLKAAMFLLAGTEAQIRARATSLYAAGIDSSFTA